MGVFGTPCKNATPCLVQQSAALAAAILIEFTTIRTFVMTPQRFDLKRD